MGISGLADAVVGARHVAQTITWKDEGTGTVLNLTSATITGFKRDTSTGTVTALDGTLALLVAASGTFTWTYGATDVAAAGIYEVQFIATYGAADLDRNILADWVARYTGRTVPQELANATAEVARGEL